MFHESAGAYVDIDGRLQMKPEFAIPIRRFVERYA
jgi:hypothetical protein